MKKLLIGFLCCFSSFVNARTLDCDDSYSLFKTIIQAKDDAIRSKDSKEIYDYVETYDYSALFNKNHPGQKFWIFESPSVFRNKWMSSSEYKKKVKKLLLANARDNSNKIDSSTHYIYDLLPTKANFFSERGEVCVVPVQRDLQTLDMFGEQMIAQGMRIDHLFVRDLRNNEWRVLEYNRYFEEKDFYEFFQSDFDDMRSELDDGVIFAGEAEADEAK